MASSDYFLSLLGAMDRLWFHQIILLSHPTPLIFPQSIQPAQPFTDSFPSPSPSPSLSLSPLDDEELSSEFSPVGDEENFSGLPPNSTLKDDSNCEEEVDDDDDDDDDDDEEEEEEECTNQKQRPTRSNFTSPLAENMKDPRYSRRRLQKSMSCRTMGELELEEVKGFTDLGFIFKKEHMSPRMMSLLPGLQRLGVNKNKEKTDEIVGIEAEEKRDTITRPYLSEAWLIKKPNSPLLNLRIPKVSAAADMKKLLRFWARNVASEIQ
ncbi:uncharacterized protein LOC107434033 [Ziziphus jujuba]|uniref:Uncharacterized protein LOC107434033 n=2 Tax=Ziziphus jujuba TaxID=326968 RepID=A0A6P4BP67_ZIZJJ|nr:uncharacterized protein LOC107434033 [Ziziphus jujuba]